MATIQKTVEGKTVTGEYEVNNGMITVKALGRSKTTQVGELSEQIVADMLLGEIAHSSA